VLFRSSQRARGARALLPAFAAVALAAAAAIAPRALAGQASQALADRAAGASRVPTAAVPSARRPAPQQGPQAGPPAGGATFALPLTLTGRSRVSVSVSLGAAAAGDTLPPPRVLVRDAAGVFRPLAPGGPPVLVVDRAQPNGSTRVDVQGWVERSPAGADPKRLPLLYTVWYPDSP
jgi:hypothetical protein